MVLVRGRNYNDRKVKFRAAHAPAAVQNPPPPIRNEKILKLRVRNSQFKIDKLISQLKNVQVKQRKWVFREMFGMQETIYLGKPDVKY